ncbi:hypothetical protein [Aquipseudomonas alcaligenes]|uniref:hypothetical protein n=1 Tax=Aquipseudomonas alcaligenes TaxID=43263 RepID=UPI0037499D15
MTNHLPPLDFSLEPKLDIATAKPKAHFQIDTRDHSKGDRRRHEERRQTIRFEGERRSGVDRRPHSPGWELGIDL